MLGTVPKSLQERTPLQTSRLTPWLLPARLAAAALLLCLQAAGRSQERPQQKEAPVAGDTASEASEVPSVPGLSALLRGANGGITFSSVHDAQTGYATLMQPAFGYSFSDIFALDVTVPIYTYRLASSQAANPKPNQLLIPQRGEIGDVIIGLHAQFVPPHFEYEATLSVSAPTGDEDNGLSTGRATFDFSNTLQHSFRTVTPSVELGIGDSTSLANRLVIKDYTSLGQLAHFQLGAAFPLLWGISFSTNAYEQLPVGDQKIYQTVINKKTTTLVVAGHSVTEDNGFTNSIDIPLDRHTTFSAYYSRSLRLHDDIVSFGLTYVLRGTRLSRQMSDDELIDAIQQKLAEPIPTPKTNVPPR